MDTRTLIRHELRNQRRHLAPKVQQQAAQQISDTILQSKLLDNRENIAFYVANDGELDPSALLRDCHKLGKRCYLPVINPERRFGMLFLPYEPGDTLVANRYDILEPEFHEDRIIEPENLDMVFAPLVQFDKVGNRIGMGAGFYDRCFEFLKSPEHPAMLFGLAYDFQKTEHIAPESWDVPLDGVVTDKAIYIF